MLAALFEKYSGIARPQLRLRVLADAVLAALLTALTPVLYGIRYLDAPAAANVLEQFVALTGILLFTPLFLPEQDPAIREIVDSKWTSPAVAPVLRLLAQMLVLAALTGGFILLLRLGQCDFPALRFWFGTFVTALALGSAGAAVSSFSGNTVLGYMAALSYYLTNLFSGGRFGKFSLFTLGSGRLDEKYVLLGCAAMLFALAIGFRAVPRRLR